MKKLLVLFALTVVLISCGQKTDTSLPVEKFQEEITKPDIILLDVRTPEEYAEGHLANSINLDFRSTNFETRIDSLDKTKTYEIYCHSGKRSSNSVKLMREKGFKDVHDLKGGILEWQAKGLPVTK